MQISYGSETKEWILSVKGWNCSRSRVAHFSCKSPPQEGFQGTNKRDIMSIRMLRWSISRFAHWENDKLMETHLLWFAFLWGPHLISLLPSSPAGETVSFDSFHTLVLTFASFSELFHLTLKMSLANVDVTLTNNFCYSSSSPFSFRWEKEMTFGLSNLGGGLFMTKSDAARMPSSQYHVSWDGFIFMCEKHDMIHLLMTDSKFWDNMWIIQDVRSQLHKL